MKMKYIESISNYRSFLMGISIIMIMFFHNLWVRDVIWLMPLNFFGDFGVDVFLFLSGFGIVYSLRKNNLKTFFKNRFVRIIPLCVICGFSKFLVSHYIIKNDELWGWQTFIGFDLWYVKAILILYFLSPFIYRNLAKYGYAILFLTYIIAIAAIHLTSNGFVCLFAPRIPVFLIGMMIATNKIVFKRRVLFFSFLLFVIAILHRLSFILSNGFWGNPNGTVLFVSGGIFFLVFLLMQSYALFQKLLLIPFIEFSSYHSLELFIVHVFVYRIIIPEYYSQLPDTLIFITAFLGAYPLAYIAYLLKELFLSVFKSANH